MKIYMNIESYF